jgi:hypothetical protein
VFDRGLAFKIRVVVSNTYHRCMSRAERRRQERAKAKQAQAKSLPSVYSESVLPPKRRSKPSAAIRIEGGKNNYVGYNFSAGFDVGVEAIDTEGLVAEHNISVGPGRRGSS